MVKILVFKGFGEGKEHSCWNTHIISKSLIWKLLIFAAWNFGGDRKKYDHKLVLQKKFKMYVNAASLETNLKYINGMASLMKITVYGKWLKNMKTTCK